MLDPLRSSLGDGRKRERVLIKYDPADLSQVYVYDHVFTQQYLNVPAVAQAYTANLSLWKHRGIRAFARREQGKADLTALGRARRRVQEIVEAAFRETRRPRSNIARWRGDAAKQNTLPATASNAVPEETSIGREPLVDQPTADLELNGWEFNYNLPK